MLTIYEVRSFSLVTKTPKTAYLLREVVGVGKGSSEPGREMEGLTTEEQLRRVAKTKCRT